MTYNVLMGTLNPILTHSTFASVLGLNGCGNSGGYRDEQPQYTAETYRDEFTAHGMPRFNSFAGIVRTLDAVRLFDRTII